MTEGDDGTPRSAYQPGESVWVFVLGSWQLAVVVGTEEGGNVLASYRRLDGSLAERAFPLSSVVRRTHSDGPDPAVVPLGCAPCSVRPSRS